MENHGKLLVVEGGDGSGKGTQLHRLQAALQHYATIVRTREPGGSVVAENIRALILNGKADKMDSMTELLLMYAARTSHMRDTINPALLRGDWVLCDRWADSSRVYQGIAGDLGLDTVEALHKLTLGDMKPDLTLILDVPAEIGLGRAFSRGGEEDRMEQKGIDYHNKVRDGYRYLAERSNSHFIINANQPIDDVTEELFAIVSKYLHIDLIFNNESQPTLS